MLQGVLDDLHAADQSSLLLLRFLAREVRSSPVLIIGAYRDEIDRANELIRGTALDAPPAWRDPLWEEWGRDFPDDIGPGSTFT